MNREQILETRTKLGLELNDSPIMMHELYQKGFYIACDKTGRFDIAGRGVEVSKRISFYNQERNLVFDLDVFDVNEERILANKRAWQMSLMSISALSKEISTSAYPIYLYRKTRSYII